MICRLLPGLLLLPLGLLLLPSLLLLLLLLSAPLSPSLKLSLAEAVPCWSSGGADRATTRNRCGCCCCAMCRGRTWGKAASGAAAVQGWRGPLCRSSASLWAGKRAGAAGAARVSHTAMLQLSWHSY